jgi:hypothetical protein
VSGLFWFLAQVKAPAGTKEKKLAAEIANGRLVALVKLGGIQ